MLNRIWEQKSYEAKIDKVQELNILNEWEEFQPSSNALNIIEHFERLIRKMEKLSVATCTQRKLEKFKQLVRSEFLSINRTNAVNAYNNNETDEV